MKTPAAGHPLPRGEGYWFSTSPGVQPKSWDMLSPVGKGKDASGLAQRLVHFTQPFGFLKDLARPGAIGSADDAILLHHVDEPRGATVAEAQTALEEGSGSLAGFDHQAHGFVVNGVEFRLFLVVLSSGFFAVAVLNRFQEFLVVLRLRLVLPPIDDL